MLIPVTPPQSYGPEHLLTFHNLKRIGLLTEQAAGETLTAVESRVSKLVTDRAAGESRSHGEPRGRAAHGRELPGWGQARGWCWLCCPYSAWCLHSCWAPAGSCCATSWGSELLLSSFPGKITDAFNSLARKSNFRAISKKLGLVRLGGLLGCSAAARPVPWPAPELLTPWLCVTPWGCCLVPGLPRPAVRAVLCMARGMTRGQLRDPAASAASPQIPRLDGEYDLKVPRDMAYVFSGAYTPLSCKIIEQVGAGRGQAPSTPGGARPRAPAACRP